LLLTYDKNVMMSTNARYWPEVKLRPPRAAITMAMPGGSRDRSISQRTLGSAS
jgi:hypothetical protein